MQASHPSIQCHAQPQIYQGSHQYPVTLRGMHCRGMACSQLMYTVASACHVVPMLRTLGHTGLLPAHLHACFVQCTSITGALQCESDRIDHGRAFWAQCTTHALVQASSSNRWTC